MAVRFRCQLAGIRGFPTLLAGATGEGYHMITHGFCALADIDGVVAEWAGAAPETPSDFR